MRHGYAFKKLNRTSSHRKAMMSNMAVSIIRHGTIKTTLPKAKAIRPFLEKIITKAKRSPSSLHVRRQILSVLKCNDAVQKLFDTIAVKYVDRPGGYISILKYGFRAGDNAPMALLRLL